MTVKERIRAITADRILVADGAIGTLLQMRGLKPGSPPEVMLLEAQQEVEAIHRLYVDAGADMITTNSFGASRPKLAQHGLASSFEIINQRAVAVARSAANGRALVAASIGPTGELLQPMGQITLPELLQIFRDQARVFKRAGADLAIIETMGDLGELQAAARACFLEDLPFMAAMTFNEAGRSLSGSTPEIVAITLEPYNPLAIGTNCGRGLDEMLQHVRELSSATDHLLLAQPNAGLPELVGGKTVFRLSPSQFADYGIQLAAVGAAIIGGCCGTTPDHVLALRRAVTGVKPHRRTGNSRVRFSARSGVAIAGADMPFCVIGERINPTGRKLLSRQLQAGDFSLLRKDAGLQVERGAKILDLNVGIPDIDESALMINVIHEIQAMLPGTPISIDSNDPHTLAAGLDHIVGIPLMNSINGDEKRLNSLLPLVLHSGANFIALAMDETGIPVDANARMKILHRILKASDSLGIARNRILVDCLVFTVASQPHQARETLRSIQRVRDELGCGTTLGVSNVSFGLPGRDILSSTFLAMAIEAGLSAGIINPMSDRMMETVRAADLLSNRDTGARQYVSFISEKDERENKKAESGLPVSKPKTTRSESGTDVVGDVQKRVLDGDRKGIISAIDGSLRSGHSPGAILSEELVPAIQEVGKRYGRGEIYLPQLILAGETMRTGVNYIRPMMSQITDSGLHGIPLVIGTVAGDIHDIGKNIVAIVLENQGFEVIDLGKNVTADRFVEAVKKNGAPVVALSALMTTTMPTMESTLKTLKDKFPDIKVMIGGAVVTQSFADRIGADGYAREAVGAGEIARELAGFPVL